jgi:DNA-binding IclR family transcriptional regulator
VAPGRTGKLLAAPRSQHVPPEIQDTPTEMLRAVSRAVTIMEAVGAASTGLSVAGIARQCGLHPATTRYQVRTLIHHGYLLRLDIGHGRYVLGPAVADRADDLAAQLRRRHDTGAAVTDLASQLQRPPSLVQRLLTSAATLPAAPCPCGDDREPDRDCYDIR